MLASSFFRLEIDKLQFIGEMQIVGRCLGAAAKSADDLRGADSRGRLSLQSSQDFSLTAKRFLTDLTVGTTRHRRGVRLHLPTVWYTTVRIALFSNVRNGGRQAPALRFASPR